MDMQEFASTMSRAAPPAGLTPVLEALWFAGKGDWERAHQIVQDLDAKAAALVHAYLHRVEGDLSNAGYWYRRAGRKMPDSTLESEWETLAGEFFEQTRK